jgi:hypothetical protein
MSLSRLFSSASKITVSNLSPKENSNFAQSHKQAAVVSRNPGKLYHPSSLPSYGEAMSKAKI